MSHLPLNFRFGVVAKKVRMTVMLEKFISIKNIGRFRDCNPRGDVTFRKLTLLFAENGQGKTTLCAILRSLESGREEFISERKAIGVSEPASVQIRLDGDTISFSNNAWTTTHPRIGIFDSVFVHDNVYAGDYIDHEHKKNLYRIIVGTQGVQLAQQVDALDAQIRNANTDIRAKKDAASRFLPQGITLEAYLAWQPVEDIDAKILQKSTEIANRRRASEKAGEIQAKGLLARIQLPSFPSDFATILSEQLTDIIADAEAWVRQQVAQHQMGTQGESWLSQGLGYVKNDQCPFCGQNIRLNDLIAAYRAQFGAAYKILKQKVAQLSQRITGAIGDPSLNSAQQTISGNLILIEFWRQFTEITLPDFTFDQVHQKYSHLREQALALAQKKQENPTQPVSLDEGFLSALADAQSLQQGIEAYNLAVDSCNARINEQKASAQRGGDLAILHKELAELEAKKKRFETEVVQTCQEYQNAQQVKTQLEEQKQVAKEELDRYCENILQTFQQGINSYLDQFNAGFRIVNTKHRYTGGTASSQFQIAINNCSIDLGDSRTSLGTPCFRTTLSAGDRSALAFAFFLAALKQDQQIGEKIIVLDDPFTSLDRFRRTCTQQLIRQLASNAGQVIVLSHDPHFLKLLWDECPVNDVKALQMSKSGNTTVIGEWDIIAETQSRYLKDYSTVLDFYREKRGDPRSVARAIRPFLEGMLRSHFPGHFHQNEWLGDFINKIRYADPSSGLNHAQSDLTEIEAINDYSKRYHHAQNPGYDSEPINSDELHCYVKRTLNMVGGE
jgi:wobble nucleotide-excising tRNase